MKRVLSGILAVSLIFSLVGCATNSKPNISSDINDKSSSSETKLDLSDSDSGQETDANIKIASWSLSKDYSGKEVIVIEYEWTNTKDDDASFMTSFVDKVYQNGIECENALLVDGVDAQQQMNNIKPNITYKIKIAYVLQDKTTVNVVVDKFLGAEVLNEKIDLGGGEGNSAPNEELQDTSVEVADFKISSDFKGDKVLVINYDFYNGENSAKAFIFLFNDKVFQNGIECDSAVIGCNDVDSQSQMNEIQPGVTYTVSIGYHISDMSDVEIQITDLFGKTEFLNEKLSIS
ncbi:MAG: DUF5067 domain-containing protein [Oscillospiraceae bacterium]|nr:DUF5067 domain-containing protein [Oscillospiraceae bacterium]